MRESLSEYCQRADRGDLLDQWHPTRNGALTPEDVSYGGHTRVWWQCEKGHAWQTVVYIRTSGESGCPYCAGKRPWPGFNDLASQYPALAAQWDPDKNGALTPDQVVSGSQKKVWWRCDCGHQWQAQVKARTAGSDCPVCAGRTLRPGINDLASCHPALIAQWSHEKNGSLRPEDMRDSSRRKVWWQCERGHTWRASIVSRVNGAGCPVCAGKTVLSGFNDFASLFPNLVAQWDQAKNGSLMPDMVTRASNRVVWWRCDLGHSWRAAVSVRTRGSDCPYCAGRKVLAGFNDLETVFPEIAAQWHPDLNGGLTPDMVTSGSHRKVWWQCGEGHVWKAVIYSRTSERRCGCPVCAGRTKLRTKPLVRAGNPEKNMK